jgi:hypothetical protein
LPWPAPRSRSGRRIAHPKGEPKELFRKIKHLTLWGELPQAEYRPLLPQAMQITPAMHNTPTALRCKRLILTGDGEAHGAIPIT